MEAVLSSLLSFLLVYKYVGLFSVAFLAAFLLPLPSSSILAAAGAFAAQGYFSITTVLIVAFLGNILGDTAAYMLARYTGTTLLARIGFKKILNSKLFSTVSMYMTHFSYSLIFISRFITTVGPIVSILSGMTRLPYKIFFGIAVVGEIAYVLMYGLLGYYLGSEWENNISFLFEAATLIVVTGVLVALIQYRLFKKMKKSTLVD